MAYHPTFNGVTVHNTQHMRYCWGCKKPIGKRKTSWHYGRPGSYVDVCQRCHGRADAPGYEHRIPKVPGNPGRR